MKKKALLEQLEDRIESHGKSIEDFGEILGPIKSPGAPSFDSANNFVEALEQLAARLDIHVESTRFGLI